MSNGRLHGTVELYDPDEVSQVQIGAYLVPLEADPTAALAYRLEGSPVWDFEIAGFRKGDFTFFGNSSDSDDAGLYMAHPYRPSQIPVVFVHGTASSPARWAEMANELIGDPAIARAISYGSSSITPATLLCCRPCDCGNPLRLCAETSILREKILRSTTWS
jgi:hypothetical protein